MAKQRKSFPLRISQDLYDQIRGWADQEMRSVNGQIEYILRQAVNRRRHEHGTEQPHDRADEPTGEE